MENLLIIISSLLGGLNIFQLIGYKSTLKRLSAEARASDIDAQQKGLDMMQDQADFLLHKLSSLQSEYTALQKQVREEAAAHTQTINDKCNEIASLKSQVFYYKGLRCYKMDCPIRVRHNPNNPKNIEDETKRN